MRIFKILCFGSIIIANLSHSYAQDFKFLGRNDSINIALLLPFNASKVEPYNLFDKKAFANSDLAIDFYSGVKFALDEFVAKGLKIKLRIYDSENDSIQLKKTLYSSGFKTPDIIIGPIYPSLFSVMHAYTLDKKIPVVSPISPVLLDKYKNPNFIMMAPPLEDYGKALSTYISSKPKPKKVFVLNTSDPIDKRLAKSFIKSLDSLDKLTKVNEFNPLLNGFNAFEHSLSKVDTNYVLVSTSNVENLVNLFNNLKNYSNTYPMVVLGHPNLEKVYAVDYAVLEKLNLTIPSTNYNNLFFSSDSLMLGYRAQFFTDPSDYAIKGFQLMNFLVDRFMLYGENYIENIATEKSKDSSLYFARSKNGTLINQKIKIVRFKNSQLEEINVVR